MANVRVGYQRGTVALVHQTGLSAHHGCRMRPTNTPAAPSVHMQSIDDPTHFGLGVPAFGRSLAVPRIAVLLRLAESQGPIPPNSDRSALGATPTHRPRHDLHIGTRPRTWPSPGGHLLRAVRSGWPCSMDAAGCRREWFIHECRRRRQHGPEGVLPAVLAAGQLGGFVLAGLWHRVAVDAGAGRDRRLLGIARWIWLFPLTLLVLSVALGAGLWLSALNVRYRDVRHAVPFLVQLWFFASPVVYSAEIVPDDLWLVYHLNPMAGAIEGYRWVDLRRDRCSADCGHRHRYRRDSVHAAHRPGVLPAHGTHLRGRHLT